MARPTLSCMPTACKDDLGAFSLFRGTRTRLGIACQRHHDTAAAAFTHEPAPRCRRHADKQLKWLVETGMRIEACASSTSPRTCSMKCVRETEWEREKKRDMRGKTHIWHDTSAYDAYVAGYEPMVNNFKSLWT